MDMIRVRPVHPKADIPDPAHGFAPLPYSDSGVEVEYSPYWAGHLAHGDVVLVEAATAAPPAPELAAVDEPAALETPAELA